MNNCKSIVEYCGKDECERIGRWVDYCHKHQKATTVQDAYKEALLLLDKSSIPMMTFYVIVSYLIIERDDFWFFPDLNDFVNGDVPWRGISNALTRYCGVAFNWDEGWLRIWEQDKYWCPLRERWIYCDGKKEWLS